MNERILATVNGARIVIEVPVGQDAETLYKWIDGKPLFVTEIQRQEWKTV